MLIFSIQTLSYSDLIIEAIVQIYYRHIYRQTKTIITVLDFWYDIQTHKRWIKQITNKMTPDYFMQAACIFHMDLTLYAIQICEKEKKKSTFSTINLYSDIFLTTLQQWHDGIILTFYLKCEICDQRSQSNMTWRSQLPVTPEPFGKLTWSVRLGKSVKKAGLKYSSSLLCIVRKRSEKVNQ